MPIDGRSLLPAARGEVDLDDLAIGEYCAEMTPHPVVMRIRRKNMKYIHCDIDPAQLYDLDNDPAELTNLANDPAYAETAQAFADEVATRWDLTKLRADVVRTQKQRRAIHAAMEAGAGEPWDYNPPRDASNEYVRNNQIGPWPQPVSDTQRHSIVSPISISKGLNGIADVAISRWAF